MGDATQALEARVAVLEEHIRRVLLIVGAAHMAIVCGGDVQQLR
jgi:hypothetical protein